MKKMVRKKVAMGNDEPDQINRDLPSEKEHFFQVVNVLTLNPSSVDIHHVKCEVADGEEIGRTLLNRLSLDAGWKGFFATRLFLKAIGEPYKGNEIEIETNNWIGRQFFATVIHNNGYANINKYNFEKSSKIRQFKIEADPKEKNAEVAWDE